MTNGYCFSVLALGTKYQIFARTFSQDLGRYAPEVQVIIGTDNPGFFRDCPNAIAFNITSQGILTCYNDKRFVIGEALKNVGLVVQIDADTEIRGPLPVAIVPATGVMATHVEPIIEHAQKYNPERIKCLRKLADKLDLDIDAVHYVGESLFSVCAERDQGQDFIAQWDLIARYLELNGIHAGEGNGIGLAAAKAGLRVYQSPWLEAVDRSRRHLDAFVEEEVSLATDLTNRLRYHYRLNRARVQALGDFEFYYQ